MRLRFPGLGLRGLGWDFRMGRGRAGFNFAGAWEVLNMIDLWLQGFKGSASSG